MSSAIVGSIPERCLLRTVPFSVTATLCHYTRK